MTAAVEKICGACEMEYDWPGVRAGDEEYCCEACARGEPCTCSLHEHEHQTHQHTPGEEAERLGITSEPVY